MDKTKDSMKLLKGAFMLALMIGIGYIPAPEPMTQFGMKVFGIFVGMIYGWIFIEIGSVSMIGIIMFVLSGCGTMGQVLPAAFGTQMSMMLIAILFLVVYAQQTEIGELIADWIMHREFLKGKPYLFFFAFLLATFMVALASNAIGATLIMCAVFVGIKDIAEFKYDSKETCLFVLGILIAALLAECALPMKSTGAMYVGFFAGVAGRDFDALRYIIAMLPICFATIGLYTLCAKYVFRPNFSRLVDAIEQLSAKPARVATKEQKIGAVVIISFVVALLIPSIPLPFAFWKSLQGLGIGGLSLLCLGIFYFIPIDGKPMLNIPVLAKGFSWDVWFMVCIIQYTVTQLSGTDAGFAALLQDRLYPVVENMSATTMVIAMIVFSVVMTNFINNFVAGSVMVTLAAILLPAFPELNIDQLFFILMLASMTSYALPSANPATAVAFGLKDFVSLGSMIRYGTLFSIILVVFICLVEWPFVKLIF